jgi:hypothetical protein
MTPLLACVIQEGNCPQHGCFRLVSQIPEIAGVCPTCHRGPVEMVKVGSGFTRRALPYYEATGKIFQALSYTTVMPNTTTKVPEGM